MSAHTLASSTLRRALKGKGREIVHPSLLVGSVPPSSDPCSSRRSFWSSSSPPPPPASTPFSSNPSFLSDTQPTLASLQDPSSSLPPNAPLLPSEHLDLLPKIDLSSLPLYEESNRLAYWFLEHPLPIPEWFPLGPYTTTIILGTIFLRTTLTLPIQIWARKREERLREVAIPRIKAFKKTTSSEYAIKQQIAKTMKSLRCSPRPMILVPLLTQLPLFITLTITLRAASEVPTPLFAEHLPSILSQINLASPDPYLVLPLAVGALAYYNTRYVRLARRERDELDPWTEEPRLKEEFEEFNQDGERVVDWRDTKQGWREGKFDQFFMLAGVTMYGVSVISPAAMQIYFLTTYSFNLLQAYFFRRSDRSRLVAIRQTLRSKGIEPVLNGDARLLSPDSPKSPRLMPLFIDNSAGLSDEARKKLAAGEVRRKAEEEKRKMSEGLARMRAGRVSGR